MYKKIYVLPLFLFLLISCKNKSEDTTIISPKDSTALVTNNGDPLPSWNDGALKKDIIAYVEKVTKEGSPDFIPVQNRIATFDNDGTLWAEKPLVQELFAFYRVKKNGGSQSCFGTKTAF